jgi:membrane-bound lytic murein transglycosylase B
VAQLNHTFTRALHTPDPDPSDSEGVLLALQTARALEAQGDTNEATRWLRRAATEAEKQGNDARVLELAHAAADLTTTVRALRSARPAPAVRRMEPSHSSESTSQVDSGVERSTGEPEPKAGSRV